MSARLDERRPCAEPLLAADPAGGASPLLGADALGAGERRAAAGALIPAGLAPIGLEEMNRRAAMLTRVDRKYILRSAELPRIMSRIDEGARVLDINGIRAHAYESTYFDTPGLEAFRASARPRRRRFKVRTRLYADSGLAFLEVKTRGRRGLTVKERIPCRAGDASRLTPEGRRWVDSLLAPLGYGEGVGASLAPVLSGRYTRITLLMPGEQGRATLDTDLEWVSAGEMRRGLRAPGLVVIETKSGSSPSNLDRLLWASGHRPRRISKYATAMAALDPDLPRNRWNRTLRTLFDED